MLFVAMGLMGSCYPMSENPDMGHPAGLHYLPLEDTSERGFAAWVF
jgi:hypothetical protein